MRGYMSAFQSHASFLSPELSSALASGFVEENGCVLLASEASASVVARDAGQDDTGYECFINHLHVKSLVEAVEFARRLKSALAACFSDSFVVIARFGWDISPSIRFLTDTSRMNALKIFSGA